MKALHSLRSCVAALVASVPVAAFAFGGTEAQTIVAGGSFSYEPGTEAGSRIWLEGRGGYYLLNGFAVGGTGSVKDDDAATVYEVAAYCQYHLFQLIGEGNDRPMGFSPYVGARLGIAHGKNVYDDSATGALIGVRGGIEIFFTDNVALDFVADLTGCTGDVYPDDDKLKSSDVSIRTGLSFHF